MKVLFLLIATASMAHANRLFEIRFDRADLNNDGQLSMTEFLGTQNGAVRWVDAAHRFNFADTDRNGFISRTEFLASRAGQAGGRPTKYGSFLLADRDEDGVLTPEEYALTEPKSRPWRIVINGFNRKDRDQNSVLSLREFGILVVPR